MFIEVNLHCEFSRGPRDIQNIYKGPRYKKNLKSLRTTGLDFHRVFLKMSRLHLTAN